MTANALIRPGAIVLDCPDPATSAAFYAALLDLPAATVRPGGGWATLAAAGFAIEFQRAEDYRAPTWPDPERPQMVHLDLRVTDLAAAARHAVAVGARPLDLSDRHPTFQVYADPDGHPFCLCAC